MNAFNHIKKIKGDFTKLVLNTNKIVLNISKFFSHIISAPSKCLVLLCLPLLLISCNKTNQYTRKGNRNYNKKEYSEAIKNYEQALKTDSTFDKANYNLGNALMQDNGKDYSKAVEHYNKYLANKTPKTSKEKREVADALYNRGNALFGLSQTNKESEEGMKYLSQAANDYKQSMILNPKDTNAKYNYALCLWLMKNNNNPDDQNDNQNNNNNSEINQMLNAIKNNEKQTISRVKKNNENVQDKHNEKDW